MKVSPAKNYKVIFAAALFLLLTAVKLLFPDQTEEARGRLREVIAHDTDYMAVFRTIGESLTGDEAVTEAFARLTGFYTPEEAEPEYYSQVTLSDLRDEQSAMLPRGTPVPDEQAELTPEPTPESEPTTEPTSEPTPEPVPEAVTAFLKAQEEFSAYGVPANVSYGYPELPFDYVSPVAGMTSSGFGYRLHPLQNEVLFHYGADFAAWTGTEILAFAGGTVGMVGWEAGYGNYIIIMHEGGWRTLYAHCSAVYVTGGETVTAGQCIGLVGATGNVTGPHLHLELTCDGVYYNPEFYLS